MRAYVGADWSSKKLVCASAVGGERARRIRGATPCLQSVRELLDRVRRRHPKCESVHVCIEGGAPGWVRLLHAAGAVVHVVDPKQAKHFSKSIRSSGAKSDPADAADLCDMLRSARHRPAPWEPDADELEPMLALAGIHEQLTQHRTRLIQQLRARLREHMPLVDQVVDLGSKWSRRFLAAVPTPWHARDLTANELRELTKRCSTQKREALVEALAKTETPWLHADVATIEAMRIRLVLEQLDQAAEHIHRVEQQLDALTRDIPVRKTLESVNGIGMKQAAILIAYAFGQGVPSHRDEAGIRMGACPVFVGSAQTTEGRPKGRAIVRRAANHRARRCTYLLGRLAQQRLPWAAAMYADGRARGQAAPTVYRRIARSLLRILSAMVRTNQPYDDAKYVAALKANGVSWAMAL